MSPTGNLPVVCGLVRATKASYHTPTSIRATKRRAVQNHARLYKYKRAKP